MKVEQVVRREGQSDEGVMKWWPFEFGLALTKEVVVGALMLQTRGFVGGASLSGKHLPPLPQVVAADFLSRSAHVSQETEASTRALSLSLHRRVRNAEHPARRPLPRKVAETPAPQPLGSPGSPQVASVAQEVSSSSRRRLVRRGNSRYQNPIGPSCTAPGHN